jgi:hypothetical protein
MQITESSLQLWLSTQTEGNLVRIYQFLFPFLMLLLVTFYGGICVTDALLIINLPEGPTAHFKLSKLVLRKDIKVLYIPCTFYYIYSYVFSNFIHVNWMCQFHFLAHIHFCTYVWFVVCSFD